MDNKMEISIIIGLIGLLVGGAGGVGISSAVKTNKNDAAIAAAQSAAIDAAARAAKETVESINQPAQNLTEPDLLKVACSAEHISKEGDLLCREMFCRMQTRGLDAKTSGTECEQISNIMNKISIRKTCEAAGDDVKKEECYDIFDRRI